MATQAENLGATIGGNTQTLQSAFKSSNKPKTGRKVVINAADSTKTLAQTSKMAETGPVEVVNSTS